MGPIILLIIFGFLIRLFTTIEWYCDDGWPTKKDGVRFYLIPFYWWYMAGRWIYNNLKDNKQ